ncbi:MAG: hypothetical protein R3B06_26755 [Kofleriaceae bacterium]
MNRIRTRSSIPTLVALAAAGAALVATPPAQAQVTASNLVKVAPENGVPAVGPVKPTWCDEVGANQTGLHHATANDNLWSYFDRAAGMTCQDPDDPLFQQQVGYYLQRWANVTGATTAQLREFLALRVGDWDAQRDAACAAVPALEEGTARAIVFRKHEREVLGCDGNPPHHIGGSRGLDGTATWHFDRTAEVPSQVAAIHHIQSCLTSDREVRMYHLVRWAVCRLDLPQLDDAKLAAEIKAAGYNDYARIITTQAMSTVRLEARRMEQIFLAKAQQDPELKAVLIDAPARGWKAWEAAVAAQRPAVEAAWAYEDKFYGPRVSAAKGCLDAVQDHLRLARSTRAGKTRAELLTAATAGVGPIFLEQLRQCYTVEGAAGGAQAVATMIQWGPPVRGPRTAAHVAMSAAAATVVADRPGFPIDGTILNLDVTSPGAMGNNVDNFGQPQQGGEVKSVTRRDGKVFITFKSTTWTEAERRCTPTNRILQWRPDGTPVYGETCRATGRKVAHTDTVQPIWILPAFAAGIKPGVFLLYRDSGDYFIGPDNRPQFGGYPVEVWKNKDQKQLIAAVGLEAK